MIDSSTIRMAGNWKKASGSEFFSALFSPLSEIDVMGVDAWCNHFAGSMNDVKPLRCSSILILR